MKVTVSFGSVRVLVPCGAGDLLVRDLVREATHRYKKATGQGPETWVGVRALRASSGGILDPDDRVRDVADDRETLTAECGGQGQPRAAQADGASGSSAGTASPDMFRGGGGVGGSMRVPNSDSCVEVGAADLDGANGLQVRRGSEPTLHQDTLPPQRQVTDQTKRWSAAVVCRDEVRLPQKHPPPEPPPERPNALHAPNHFQRQTNRLSMQFSGPGSGIWLDAADKIQTYGSKSLPRDARREPLGQDMPIHNSQNHRVEDMLRWVSGVNNVAAVHPVQERPLDLLPEVGSSERAITGMEVPVSATNKPSSGASQTVAVTLVKGEKGLGFTITTRDNPTGGHCPIYIKNILPKGAAVTDGRLRAGDQLLSVNNQSVSGLTQQQVVQLLRNTPTDCTVDIVVSRPTTRMQRVEPQQSPTKYIENAIGLPPSLPKPNEVQIGKGTENGRVSNIVNAINNNSVRGRIRKSSSKDELRNKEMSPDSALKEALNSSSNSILGLRNRLILRLDVPVHDSEKAGLGISVKGKVTVGPDPLDLGIFIKSVLNGGAASKDGRLQTNDQLLSVNGKSLAGQSNAEAMETLRGALMHARPFVHGRISLTIARRTESMDSLARWKDDTPPNGNDSTNSTDHSNSNNFANTVIYNTNNNTEKEVKTTSPVNNNIVSKFEVNKKPKERIYDSHDGRSSKRHASIVTINNNNSWVSNQSDDSKGYLERDKDAPPHDSKRDSYDWSRLDGWNPVIDRLTGLRNESYYMATQTDGPPPVPVATGHMHRHGHLMRSPPHVIIEEDYGTTRGNGSATGSGTAPGESGSESGDGAFSRDALGRRSMSEKRHAAMDAKATGTYRRIKEMKEANSGPVGQSLGLRKSSSLESLQTAIQETQRNPRNEPHYARAHQPLKHWLTDDNHMPGGHGPRGSPQQRSLNQKRPSLLKSLQSMLGFNKPHKKTEEVYARTQTGRSSEKSLSRDALERQSKADERNDELKKQNTLPQRGSGQHSRQASGDRSERSAEHGAPSYRVAPARTTHAQQAMDSAWGPTGHYVNYEEIQQNLNARREKLSEVQIGQMRRQVHAQRAKVDEESRRAGGPGYHSQRSCREAPPRPQSNYYEYETAPPRRPGKLSHYH